MDNTSKCFLIAYLIALGLLTSEVMRLFNEMVGTDFVETLLTNLYSTNFIVWLALIAIPILFVLWLSKIVFSVLPPEGYKQGVMCFVVLIIMLIASMFTLLSLIFMAVTFIGVYLGAVGAAISGYGDSRETSKIKKYAAFVAMIIGVLMEIANLGLLDFIDPIFRQIFSFSLIDQSASINPSGYGIGYFIIVLVIGYGIVQTVRETTELKDSIVESEQIDSENRVTLEFVINQFFMAFWLLSAIVLWPLIPFGLLDYALAILYVLGWITGAKGYL